MDWDEVAAVIGPDYVKNCERWLRLFAQKYQGAHANDSPRGIDAAMLHEIANLLDELREERK